MASPEIILVISFILSALTYRYWLSKVFRFKTVHYVIFPLILLSLWFGLLLYQSFQIENVFTLLTDEYPRSYLTQFKSGELYQGDKISGTFTANYNDLGIVGFRFWTFYRLNDDNIIFRIKEASQKDWYYQNSYKEDQFQPNQYFTFGFPTIVDSKGKTYVFEIESERGRPGVAVGASSIDPIFIAKYKYPKEEITASMQNTIRFGLIKLSSLISKSQIKASSYVYLLPFILYIITLTPFYTFLVSRFLLTFKFTIFGQEIVCSVKCLTSLVLLIVGILVDIVYIRVGDMSIITLLLLLLIFGRIYRFPAKLFFGLYLLFLAVSGVTYYLNLFPVSERAGAWAWLFLVLTLLFMLFEKWTKTSKLINVFAQP